MFYFLIWLFLFLLNIFYPMIPFFFIIGIIENFYDGWMEKQASKRPWAVLSFLIFLVIGTIIVHTVVFPQWFGPAEFAEELTGIEAPRIFGNRNRQERDKPDYDDYIDDAPWYGDPGPALDY